uniref:ATP synthase complex subunit 8 n=1 Tax=Curculionoidea sp. 22 KM-2017 TaxID=2219406 RepID=A0A346RIS6_9CUCU|nr:ATP synthase F0 subunit 8 [Curculionoidea sp. 22 KM-2017]
MPQMAPLNWLTLYFLFFMLLMIMIIMNYFTFLYEPINHLNKKSMKHTINWKW